ncbi:C39 family peptidase [Paenibacillus pabuli]|uniref:C39 family peptidase n=1 Tax=Paenibacillus pabuli TaxID=1472 RepID=UPI001FFE9E99|nr:C39 family peptidase [Paenibacillus pabuli]
MNFTLDFCWIKKRITSKNIFVQVQPVSIFKCSTICKTFTSDIPTAAQQTAKAQKNQLALQKAEQLASGISMFALGESKTIAVPSYQQEKSYWCGPATTKQVLGFFNGSSSSQTTYAKELGTTTDGTDFSLVDDVINKYQTKNTYIYQSFTSSDYLTWKSAMILSIDWGNPAVLDLKITSANMPLYPRTVEGHILNTSGYNVISENDKKLRLTDPFDEGGRGVTLGNVWHPFDGVWGANQAHFRKAILW